ncbi:MAG: OstA-like protein [Bacillota bacterium]|jgi:lipopolysaccharide export system protein LptA
MALVLVLLLQALLVTTVLATDDLQVLLDADDGIDYDMRQNITTARKNVRLTRGDLLILADQIIYYGRTGIVEASGHVVYKAGTTEYKTDFLRYNVLNNTGKSEAFKAVVAGEPRNFNITGQAVTINPAGASELSQVKITRCPKAHPHYLFSAARVELNGRRVKLKHVVLKIMGIPVLYLPVLIFYTDCGLPLLMPGYDEDDGYNLKYQFMLDDTPKREWNLKGEFSGQGDANCGFELKTKSGQMRNRTELLYYYWHDSLKFSNSFIYETPLFKATLDGSKEFQEDKEAQLGLTLTRKYWQSPLGEWQAGLLIRRVLAEDGGGETYGGTYSGICLDYKPHRNVKLSLLGIKSHTGNDYRDLMEDFGVGANALYNVKIPLHLKYTFGLSGSYNFNDDRWCHEIYSMTYNGCCFQPYIAYDRADHSWNWTLKIKF